MKKTLMCLSLAFAANTAVAAEKTPSSIDTVQAYKVIQQYRELRESCAAGEYEQRRQCVNELSKASAIYRAAKDTLSNAEVTNTSPSKAIASYQ
jgi:DNA-binding FadR family transcriptional regulator